MTSDAQADADANAATSFAAHLTYFSVAFCQPLQLLINFALFQYLFTVYFARRRQPRVVLLLLTAAVGFLTLMPFAIADKQRVASLHAISEVCCYLTFLQQITILTRDVNRKLKLRSLVWFMWCAELLIVASIIIIGLNVVQIGDPRVHVIDAEHVDAIIEAVSLWFIVVFRFYFLAMIRGGWRALWRSHRYELLFYLLFMTHGYPFHVLRRHSSLNWDSVKGAYNRLTIALCLSSSIRARFASEASMHKATTHDGAQDFNWVTPRQAPSRNNTASAVMPFRNN
ncbi:hypothetical protein PINS_up007069 [Pythium insidiosum]|nr:hypothetical protein PINS_up007069 [Pythium insidiosum]